MIVLDTHIWVRWIIEGEALPPGRVAAALQSDARVGVSAMSCMEVAHLHKVGRLALPLSVEAWISAALGPAGIECLPVTCEIASRAVQLPDHHKDPADRAIIATALVHGADLASLDTKFPLYQEIAERLLR